jgi:hypothetical protein
MKKSAVFFISRHIFLAKPRKSFPEMKERRCFSISGTRHISWAQQTVLIAPQRSFSHRNGIDSTSTGTIPDLTVLVPPLGPVAMDGREEVFPQISSQRFPHSPSQRPERSRRRRLFPGAVPLSPLETEPITANCIIPRHHVTFTALPPRPRKTDILWMMRHFIHGNLPPVWTAGVKRPPHPRSEPILWRGDRSVHGKTILAWMADDN